MPSLKSLRSTTKRGDTIVEVMFAITIFCFVAVISIAMMNSGVASAENSLEIVTARNELNAQAEALRFIHSSYISERTLPLCVEGSTEKCQQYKLLWDAIVSNAISPSQAKEGGLLDLADTAVNGSTGGAQHAVGCERIYEVSDNGTLLSRNNAFIINTRNLSSLTASRQTDVGVSYVSAKAQPEVFTLAPLNARVIYTTAQRYQQIQDGVEFDAEEDESSTQQFTDGLPIYNYVARAEGIWVVAVTDGTQNPQYYDFYIDSCWYGPNTTVPNTIDTVIRLYNPENVQ